ncbi:MAG: hypothetical protein AB7G47_09940 [Mycolicibacterium sp.]
MNQTDTTTTHAGADVGAGWATSLFARSGAPAPVIEPAGRSDEASLAADQPESAASTTVRPNPVDLNAVDLPAVPPVDAVGPADGDGPAPPPNGRAKGWAGVLIAVTAATALLAAGIMVATGQDDPAPQPKAHVPALAVGAPTVEPSAPPESGADIVPYMATAEGCYEGSTSPGALQETDTESAWECVRGFGAAGGGTNGQLLKIKLGNEMTGPRWYLVSKIEITPGWVPKVQGGRDEWAQHRVPTRVRFVFNDSSDPQRPASHWDVDTRGARGPIAYRGAKPVLASEITMVVLETQRPPADDPPAEQTSATTARLYPDLSTPAEPTEDPENPAAVDATFALSLLQIEGTLP